MPDSINPVGLGIKIPESMQTLGSIMGIAQGAQQLQLQKQAIQSGEMGLTKQRETLQPQIEQKKAESRTAVTHAAHEQYKLGKEQANDAYQIAGGLVSDKRVDQDPSSQGYSPQTHSRQSMTALMEAEDRMRASKIPEESIRAQMAPLYVAATHNPQVLPQMLKSIVMQGINASGQAAAVTPSGPQVSNQQQTSVINTNPFASGVNPGQPIPGTPQQQQLPPSTQVYGPGNVPSYLGPQPAQPKLQANAPDEQTALRIVQDASARGQGATVGVGGLQAGPSPTVAQNITTKAEGVKSHFAETQANAASSALLEGIAQNIKTFGPKAITGTEQDKLALVNGILAQLHIGSAPDLKTATDLMEKNMAQLSKNSPAATDAARVVNQLASPHPTMSAEAIKEASDQIIGQVRMSRDLYKSVLPKMLSGDNDAYLEHLKKLSDVTDARVWQFEALGPQERTNFVSQMRPEDRAAFKEKIQKAEDMGFFK